METREPDREQEIDRVAAKILADFERHSSALKEKEEEIRQTVEEWRRFAKNMARDRMAGGREILSNDSKRGEESEDANTK